MMRQRTDKDHPTDTILAHCKFWPTIRNAICTAQNRARPQRTIDCAPLHESCYVRYRDRNRLALSSHRIFASFPPNGSHARP
ncbi:unnamed protein product [Toxocara canis]|uniref:Uncharacterized protein n=1 Tax=Toxocara canis TaxID=6265 RepID=A0A183V5W6_TOXCA|nr:unnamed protein product [Toxocara canis]